MDTIFGQALLLGYLLGIAYLVTKDIPKKNIISSLTEENRLKAERDQALLDLQTSSDEAWRNLMEIVMNATYEQYFVATVLSAVLSYRLYGILRNFFFLLSTLF
jgi:nuclear transport factor 2 (NTF2) superfamily protein